eukprot:CAMPEP_0115119476 /NCGR_PEP_ID=MMETSP0227-20121206/45115_1 /TAXON_ID=89957 /ORGANISM="Polarella glacialis, Strain CCMP 1383" /LENGTH=346 /DNA_ID=CAMNT_0002520955 /DNA_START=92 /DNA_END=1131 /DNA_ORIENTATION=+
MAAEATPSPSRGANLQASAERFALQSPSTKASPRMGDRAPWCGASPVATPQRTRRRLNPAGCSPLAIRWDIDSNRASTVDPSGPACGEDPTEADFLGSLGSCRGSHSESESGASKHRRGFAAGNVYSLDDVATLELEASLWRGHGAAERLLASRRRVGTAVHAPLGRSVAALRAQGYGVPLLELEENSRGCPLSPSSCDWAAAAVSGAFAPSSPPREEEATADEVESEDLSCVSSMTPTAGAALSVPAAALTARIEVSAVVVAEAAAAAEVAVATAAPAALNAALAVAVATVTEWSTVPAARAPAAPKMTVAAALKAAPETGRHQRSRMPCTGRALDGASDDAWMW